MMRAFAYPKHGPASMQQVLQVAIPDVKDHAAAHPTVMRIKVHAASFNPIDYKRRDGALKAVTPEKAFPVILGYDASGVVDQVGPKVSKFKVGDEVYVRIGNEFPNLGTCAEYTLATEGLVAPKPKNVSFEEAASFPLAAITALQMLRRAGMKQGDKVFINAAAGGVGHFAVQLAKVMGASLVVGTSSAPKHPLLKELGCDETIDYKTQDFTQVYKDRPFDIGLDMAGEVVQMCKVVKEGGWIVSAIQGLSAVSLAEVGIHVNFVLRAALYFMRWRVDGAAKAAKVSFTGMFLRPNAADLELLTTYVEAGKVKTVIKGNVYGGLDKAADAMQALESGRTTGKVVVKVV